MSPQWPDLVLPTHIPHVELDVLVRDRLDVETDCRDRGDILVELELIEDCCKGNKESALGALFFCWGRVAVERRAWGEGGGGLEVWVDELVFPAASSPSMSRRISLDPKILPITFDICPPIFVEVVELARLGSGSAELRRDLSVKCSLPGDFSMKSIRREVNWSAAVS